VSTGRTIITTIKIRTENNKRFFSHYSIECYLIILQYDFIRLAETTIFRKIFLWSFMIIQDQRIRSCKILLSDCSTWVATSRMSSHFDACVTLRASHPSLDSHHKLFWGPQNGQEKWTPDYNITCQSGPEKFLRPWRMASSHLKYNWVAK